MSNNKNIPLFKVSMSENAIERASNVLRSSYIGQGDIVDEFEKYLKEYFNQDYVVTLNSATSAEHLALHLLKKPQKSVIDFGVGYAQSNWPGI